MTGSRDSKVPGVVRMTVGGSALVAAFVAGVATSGGLGTSAPPVDDRTGDRLVPVASKDSLLPFADCRDLLDGYVRENVRDVGPYGWAEPPTYFAAGGSLDLLSGVRGAELAPLSAPAAGIAGPGIDGPGDMVVHNSETGTNVQESGVDEPDVAKTDGSLLVHLVGNRRVVLTDVSGATPQELGGYRLPDRVRAQDLLLVGDRVLVVSSSPKLPVDIGPGFGSGGFGPGGFDPGDIELPAVPENWRGPATTLRPVTGAVLELDVSDPTDPRLVRTDRYSGAIISVRLYDDTVRVVTTTPRPELDWLFAGDGTSEREATRHNRELVRESTLDDWLPSVATDGGEQVTPDCSAVHHPRESSGHGTVAVFGYDVDEPDARDVVAVTTDSEVVYSSTDRLYVATRATDGDFWRRAYERIAGEVTGRVAPPAPDEVTTQLHSFALDGISATYVGSGHVDGTVRDRWSLDEQDGRLRVALAVPGRWGQTVENAVAVLAEQDGRLVRRGRVAGLGPDEEIKSVRWFDDFAVVVTFRQTDPLYTIDLTDPDRPVARGELKILGFSGYLHPIGDGLVLGLGQDADAQGRMRGAQAAVFDISDLTDPRRVDLLTFPGNSRMAVLDDPRAFTWLPGAQPGAGTAVTGLDSWRPDGPAPLVLEVGGGRLEADRLAERLGRAPLRALPLDDGRVALVGKDVAVVAVR